MRINMHTRAHVQIHAHLLVTGVPAANARAQQRQLWGQVWPPWPLDPEPGQLGHRRSAASEARNPGRENSEASDDSACISRAVTLAFMIG